MFFSQEANTSLVRACWNELFTLGLAQCAHVMNLSTILAAIINHLQSSIQNGTTHSTGLNEGFHMGARGQSINFCDNNNLIEMLFCLSDKLSSERVKQVMEHVWKFQEFCNSMTKLEIDSYEYAYLKALVLFSPGESALLNQSHSFLTFTQNYLEIH